MKVTVIGYWGAYPEKNEATSCYLVEGRNTKILLDLGSGALSRLFNVVEVNDIDGVFISHYHPDHIADVGVFHHFMLINKISNRREKPVYMFGLSTNQFSALGYKNIALPRVIFQGAVIDLGDFQVEFCEGQHPLISVAIKVKEKTTGKTIVYTGDTAYNERLVDFSKGSELLIAECSLYKSEKGAVKGHMCSTEAGGMARRAGVAKLLLTHLPHHGKTKQLVEEAKEVYKGEIILAAAEVIIDV